jgi:amino acid transporter
LKSVKLKRTINLVSATSIGLGAMLGAGIFVFPGLAGGYAGFAATISFLIGGIIALLTAACTAELSTAMPQSGGGYFFISRSFGNFWGTLTGLSQWIGLIFACAFYLASFGEYALTFLDELNVNWSTSTKILSFLFTLLLLVVNIIGTKKVGRFQNLMVISLTIMLVLIFTYGMIDFLGLEDNHVAFSEIAPEGVQSIFTTTALIFTSYLGFVQIANIGAEIKQPNKNLPRSLIFSVLIAMGLYIFIMLVCIVTFPQEELKNFGETATIEVARKMLGSFGALVVLLAGLLATLSSANASMISASRGVFALSKDKLISQKASKINKRFGTPHIALILVTVPIAIMLLRSRLEVFAEVASFLHLVIYAGICLSVLKLRISNPNWYIPTFRIPAAKIVATIGALGCLVLLCFMQTTSILISLGILFFATGYYFFYVKKRGIKLDNPKPPHIDANLFQPSILIPVNITEEKKDLPHAILEAMPISKLLLLGFKETPEQSDSAQSEEEFGEEGEEKLENIQNKLKEAELNFDSKLIFSNEILPQIKEIMDEEELHFILTLKPLSDLNQIVIPIYDRAQINTSLGTIVYNLHSKKPAKIKVVLFTEQDGESSNEAQLKQIVENQFSLVNVRVQDYEVKQKEELSFQEFVQQISNKEDVIIWSEAAPYDRKAFLKAILEEESKKIASPIIMILNKEKD